jgi:hypothetical protein
MCAPVLNGGRKVHKTVAPDPMSARVEKPITTPTGEMMNAMRSWLDAQRIEPLEFRMRPVGGGQSVEFELRFSTADDAALFEQQFA